MNNISLFDIKVIKIIRESVTSFIEKSSKEDKVGIRVLDIAPQIYNDVNNFFKLAIIDTLDIDPKANATYTADICDNNSIIIPNDFYDIIICTEVLEHTLDPKAACKEIYRILKKGGKCYTTTPFNFRIHGPLPDCWRFTNYGLSVLFSKFSFVDILSIEDNERPLMPLHYQTIAIK